jgi:uncharacterized membrane protein YcjF (UPF0283 family)
MTTDHLKAIFLQAHKKDKRLTFMNYAIRSFGILLALSVILFLVLTVNADQTVTCIIYLVIAAMVGTVLYPFYHYWKLNSRIKEINRLTNCVASGALAHTMKEYKRHKISIPLGKKTVNLLPVDCLCIIMNNDNRPFHLPVTKSDVQEIKKILTKNTSDSLKIEI